MKSFFRFTSGEWIASSLMSLLILGGILYYFLYHNSASAKPDYSQYADMIEDFEAEQVRLEDSVVEARKRQYSWKSRNFTSNYHRVSAFSGDSLKKKTKNRQYAIEKVELNTADTTDICRIPQFGSKRAAKIVEYRDKLGGFYSLEQIKEIYILQNVNMEYLQEYFYVDKNKIKKIQINSCDYKTIVSHPYFDNYLAKTIMSYRRKSGEIKDMEQLRELTHIYAELEEKLRWYIEF